MQLDFRITYSANTCENMFKRVPWWCPQVMKKNFLKNIENSDFSFTFSLKVSEFSHIFINFYTKFIKNARKLEIFFEKMIKYWFLLCGKCLIGVVFHVESISDSFRARTHVFLNFWGTFVPKNLPPEWRKYWKFGQKVLVWVRKI